MDPHRFDRDDATRALARAVAHLRTPARLFDAETARRIFFRAVHRRSCPRCGARARRVARDIHCPACRARTSLTATTPFARSHLSLAIRLAAIWHIHVDSETLSARAFSRRYAIRYESALRLLHEARAALPAASPTRAAARVQLLGRNGGSVVDVALAVEGAGLRACRAEDAPPVGGPARVDAVWLGRLRAWVADHFRGVTSAYLENYLAEFCARFGRVAALA
jgi:hypothetical protein